MNNKIYLPGQTYEIKYDGNSYTVSDMSYTAQHAAFRPVIFPPLPSYLDIDRFRFSYNEIVYGAASAGNTMYVRFKIEDPDTSTVYNLTEITLPDSNTLKTSGWTSLPSGIVSGLQDRHTLLGQMYAYDEGGDGTLWTASGLSIFPLPNQD